MGTSGGLELRGGSEGSRIIIGVTLGIFGCVVGNRMSRV
jgi:hypothetical protein